jgi:catechol 2,3-dioxygenase-like lactoylglutathione lyase family enzyme
MSAEAGAATGRTKAPAPVSKVGYVGVRTNDVDALVAYYTDVLQFELVERTGDGAYMTTGPDHHAVAIEQGGAHGRTKIGLQIHGSLDDAEAGLRDAGVAVERRSDAEPGVAELLSIEEPTTGTPLHLFERQAESGIAQSLELRPQKLGHVAAYVSDVATVQSFYEDVLGFRWSDTIGDFFAFLRCSVDHHTMNFMESQKLSGLHHIAYEMRDFAHMKSMFDHLSAHGIHLEWGPGRHGAGHNLFSYHRDPDGNLIELFAEIDVMYDEEAGAFEPRPWHEDRPQKPKFWELGPGAANIWGPIVPEMLDH